MHNSSVTKRKSIVEDGQQEKIPSECSRIWENQRIVNTLRPGFPQNACHTVAGQWLSYTSAHGNAGNVDTGTIIAATILRILADGAASWHAWSTLKASVICEGSWYNLWFQYKITYMVWRQRASKPQQDLHAVSPFYIYHLLSVTVFYSSASLVSHSLPHVSLALSLSLCLSLSAKDYLTQG